MSQAPYGPGPAAPAPWPTQGPPPSAPSRIPTVVAIALALIATAVAIGAWFRPVPKPEAPAAKTYSEQEVADAKKAVCDAYDAASRGLEAAGRRNEGQEPVAVLAVAANVRLALTTGSAYLFQALEEHAAAPSEVRDSVKALASTYLQIAIAQLGEASQAQLDLLYKSGDEATDRIKKACG